MRLSAALTRLGPTYVKLGQFLATRPDVVGPALARDLEIAAGQDAAVRAGRSGSRGRSRARQAAARGCSRQFGPPVAAASIAQVHRAEVARRRPQTVAVKVLRPGIERRFKSDLDTLYFAARSAERHSAEARRLRLVEVVDTLARSVTIEMDLRLEAAALSEMAREHQGRSGLPRADGRLGPHRARTC